MISPDPAAWENRQLMSFKDAHFEIAVDTGALTIAASGDIDMATAGDLGQAIRDLAASGGDGQITIDLTNVDFIDSSAVGMLIQAWETTQRIVLRNPQAQALRVLALTGVDQFIPIESEPADEALRAGTD